MNTEILSNLIITGIRSATTMYSEKNAGAFRSDRELWAVVIKYEGETVYRSGGREYRSDIGHIALLPKGSSYEWVCMKSGHFSIVEFESDCECEEIFSFAVRNGEHFLARIKRLELELTLGRESSTPYAMSEIYGVISSLIGSIEEKYLPSSKYKQILPAIEYIAENFDRKLSNDELASLVGISTVYFRKLFKEVTGSSPIEYLISLRNKKAAEMLESDYSSISDIAYSLGYNNVYEFSKSFKKHYGVSPREYQKRQQAACG